VGNCLSSAETHQGDRRSRSARTTERRLEAATLAESSEKRTNAASSGAFLLSWSWLAFGFLPLAFLAPFALCPNGALAELRRCLVEEIDVCASKNAFLNLAPLAQRCSTDLPDCTVLHSNHVFSRTIRPATFSCISPPSGLMWRKSEPLAS